MTLIYDEILDAMSSGKWNDDFSDEPLLEQFGIKQSIRDCVVFGINNVADYLFESKEQPIVKELPNVAPPYPAMWFEYTYKRRPQNDNLRVAVMMKSTRVSEYLCDDQDGGIFCNITGDKDIDKLFFTRSVILYGNHRAMVSLNIISCVICDEEGKPIFTRTILDPRQRDNATAMWFLAIPAFFAISFMHCKNVKVQANHPARGGYSKRGEPRAKFYTLAINPMKKILEREGGANKTGLKLSLHICRGHFKDFSNGNGLFGKYKGMYWWDSQVRGNSRAGIVVKDYKINSGDKS